MTASINKVNRICGIIRNLSLLLLTVFWGILGELGVYQTPIGFSCAVGLFIAFLIPAIIKARKNKMKEDVELAEFEKSLDEGIQNGSITKEKLEQRMNEIEDKIKANEKIIRKNNLILAVLTIIAMVVAFLALYCRLMTVPDIICIIILTWPAFQISGGIKSFVKKVLEKRVYCNEKC